MVNVPCKFFTDNVGLAKEQKYWQQSWCKISEKKTFKLHIKSIISGRILNLKFD